MSSFYNTISGICWLSTLRNLGVLQSEILDVYWQTVFPVAFQEKCSLIFSSANCNIHGKSYTVLECVVDPMTLIIPHQAMDCQSKAVSLRGWLVQPFVPATYWVRRRSCTSSVLESFGIQLSKEDWRRRRANSGWQAWPSTLQPVNFIWSPWWTTNISCGLKLLRWTRIHRLDSC